MKVIGVPWGSKITLQASVPARPVHPEGCRLNLGLLICVGVDALLQGLQGLLQALLQPPIGFQGVYDRRVLLFSGEHAV